MREQIHSSKRRHGPKQPLPLNGSAFNDTLELQESPYYTIDNTEDIYGTKLLPSQRCYVDPWDLENYDYVRSKIDLTTPPRDYYNDAPSPSLLEDTSNITYYNITERNTTTPTNLNNGTTGGRPMTPSAQMECCKPMLWPQINNFNYIYQPDYNDDGEDNDDDDDDDDDYDDYLMAMSPKPEHNIYAGYGGANSHSTCSASDRNIALGDYTCNTIKGNSLASYEALKRRTSKLTAPPPQLEFPMSPLIPTNYDYCKPYSTTLPCWSTSDCYECLSQIYKTQSLYTSIRTAGACCSLMDNAVRGNTIDHRRPSSSLYSTIYGNKFGMSSKGLLQIDYSCSWHDLNRAMARNY